MAIGIRVNLAERKNMARYLPLGLADLAVTSETIALIRFRFPFYSVDGKGKPETPAVLCDFRARLDGINRHSTTATEN
jgi:hypothetical protein